MVALVSYCFSILAPPLPHSLSHTHTHTHPLSLSLSPFSFFSHCRTLNAAQDLNLIIMATCHNLPMFAVTAESITIAIGGRSATEGVCVHQTIHN